MNKKYILFAILLTIFIIILYFILIQDNINCDKLKNDIDQLLDKANNCELVSDCEVNAEFGCPFGCYNLANKNADLSYIRDKVKDYNSNCAICMYGCAGNPKQEDIQCRNNKCIDIRYE